MDLLEVDIRGARDGSLWVVRRQPQLQMASDAAVIIADWLALTYAGLIELPKVIQAKMEDEPNGLLDQEFSDTIGAIEPVKTGDFSSPSGSASADMGGRISIQTPLLGRVKQDSSKMGVLDLNRPLHTRIERSAQTMADLT